MRWTAAALILLVSAAHAQNPTITLQPVSTTVMLGQPVTFSVQASGANAYLWFRDGEPIAGSTSASYTFVPALTDSGHTYTAGANSLLGSSLSQTAWLHVTPRTDTPTVTQVESFGTVSAPRVASSFGLGVDSYQDWEFGAVAAMGGTWIRADGCQWEQVEVQVMPGNTSNGFAPANSSNCLAEVSSALRYHLSLDTVAYWAPPSANIAAVTVTSAVPAGSQSLPVAVTSGTFSGYNPQSLLIFGSTAMNARIDGGAPVASLAGTTLQLPEPTLAAIPAGTSLTVKALLYPPALIPAGTSYTGNPSIQAWLNYISAVQHYLSTSGVSGTVELWNEPEQSNQLWDFPSAYYTSPPGNVNIGGTGRALAYAAAQLPAVPGVKLLNGWTDVSGDQSLFNTSTLSTLPVSASLVKQSFLGESMHPYGNNPEQTAWLPAVIAADAIAGSENPSAETPIGGQVGANLKLIPYFNQVPSVAGSLNASITETGLAMTTGVTETQRTRFNLRQFLSFAGLGVSPIIFFKAGNDPSYEWFGEDTSHTPHPVVASFTGLLADINAISAPSSLPTGSTSPVVVGPYTGYYPLATVTMAGTRPGDTSNSILFFSWQKTFTVPPSGGSGENESNAPAWTSLASPASVPVTITLPANYLVSSVKDVLAQTTVAFTQTGSQLTYPVSDDPVEVLLVPASPATAQTISFPLVAAGVTYGAPSATLAAVASSGLAVSYAVTGPATLAGSQLSFTGAGNVVVTASQSGNSTFASASPVSQVIAVSPADLQIAVAGQPTRYYGQPNPTFTCAITGLVNGDTQASATYGAPALTTSATSTSPAGTYPISTSRGTFSAPNYTFDFVDGTLTINGNSAQSITFPALSSFAVGSQVTLVATSSSGLPVSFAVVSGPATLGADNVLTVQATGTVTVIATQPGNINFSAAASVVRTFQAN